MLGTDIRRSPKCAAMPLTTSMQQSNLIHAAMGGDAVLVGGTGVATVLQKADSILVTPTVKHGTTWVWHGGMLYVVLSDPAGPIAVVTSSTIRAGAEWNITQGSNQTIAAAVFSAVLSHGDGDALSYAYAVVPCSDPAAAAAAAEFLDRTVVVVTNRKPVQAVCAPGRALQAVLWPSSTAATILGDAAGCWNISVPKGPALELGVVLQLRMVAAPRPAYAFAVTAPATDQMVKDDPLVASFFVSGLQIEGDGCNARRDGRGTDITVKLDRGGNTTTARCSIIEETAARTTRL